MSDPNIQAAMDLHRQGRLDEADVIYRELLARRPNEFEPSYLLGVLKLQQGQSAEALTHLSRAVQARPQDPDALGNLGAALLSVARNEEALATFDRVIALRPSDIGALCNRATVLMNLSRPQDAIASYDKVLALQPGHFNALFNRGGLLASLGRYDEALANLDQVLALAPDSADAHNNRGNVLVQLGRHEEAVASYDRGLAINPDEVRLLSNRGGALTRLGRFDAALASLHRALALKPDHLDALNNLGNSLLAIFRTTEALAMFERALTVRPDDPEVLTNRAIALRALHRYPEALASVEAALAVAPTYPNAWLTRGHVLMKLERQGEAAESYETASRIAPNDPFAFGSSVIAHLAVCNWERTADLLADVEQEIDRGQAVIPPFNLLGLPLSPGHQLQCAQNYVRRELGAPQPLPSRAPTRTEKIRLAYVSGDFRQHPVAYLISELFERHDRSRFEVIGVSYGQDDASAERARIMRGVDRFVDLWGKSDGEAAALIRGLEVDIAVDLVGHTENSRSGILGARPAPVQVAYLGFAGTLGADFIDYVIADKIVAPFEQQAHWSEKIVHLPDCYFVNDATKAIAAQTPSRAEAGLPERGFVFCCFNNSYKLSAPVFAVWMRLLNAIEGSVLWVSQPNQTAMTNLRAAAVAAGIAPERLIFAPRVAEMADHLARHRLADLFLDTLPYNAHTTASDALWAGLPVVTCQGETFAGRVATSLVHAVALPELAANSLEDYEVLALKLARDPALLRSVREKLAHNRLRAPLFDSDRFRRHIEAAYERMWETWQQGEAPQSFAVDPIGN